MPSVIKPLFVIFWTWHSLFSSTSLKDSRFQIYKFGVFSLRAVISIAKPTTPTKSASKFLRRHVTCNRDISDNYHPVSVFGKAAEEGKFEVLRE